VQGLNAKLKQFEGIKDNAQLDEAGKILAEELKTLIPAFLAKYAAASEGQQKQLAGVKAKAEVVIKIITNSTKNTESTTLFIPEVSHWEVNITKVSPTNIAPLANKYTKLGVDCFPNLGIYHNIELICYLKNYSNEYAVYELSRNIIEANIWLKKRNGKWELYYEYPPSIDDATSADETRHPDKFGCLYALDSPGLPNAYLAPIIKKARKYEAIKFISNFEENLSIDGKMSAIICPWHIEVTAFFDKKGVITKPDIGNAIGAGHISLAHHRILENRLKEQQPQWGFTIDSRRFQPAAMKEKAVFPKKCDEPYLLNPKI
jgi:hypothetical protein